MELFGYLFFEIRIFFYFNYFVDFGYNVEIM